MPEVWKPFVYREYFDVPRMIVVPLEDHLLLLASLFDDELDDYDPEYKCYLLPTDTNLEGPGLTWS